MNAAEFLISFSNPKDAAIIEAIASNRTLEIDVDTFSNKLGLFDSQQSKMIWERGCGMALTAIFSTDCRHVISAEVQEKNTTLVQIADSTNGDIIHSFTIPKFTPSSDWVNNMPISPRNLIALTEEEYALIGYNIGESKGLAPNVAPTIAVFNSNGLLSITTMDELKGFKHYFNHNISKNERHVIKVVADSGAWPVRFVQLRHDDLRKGISFRQIGPAETSLNLSSVLSTKSGSFLATTTDNKLVSFDLDGNILSERVINYPKAALFQAELLGLSETGHPVLQLIRVTDGGLPKGDSFAVVVEGDDITLLDEQLPYIAPSASKHGQYYFLDSASSELIISPSTSGLRVALPETPMRPYDIHVCPQ